MWSFAGTSLNAPSMSQKEIVSYAAVMDPTSPFNAAASIGTPHLGVQGQGVRGAKTMV